MPRTSNSSPGPSPSGSPNDAGSPPKRLFKRSYNSDDVQALSRGRSESLTGLPRPRIPGINSGSAGQSPERRSPKNGGSRASSPGVGPGIVIASSTPLVGDTKIATTRMVITKQHISYPQANPLIPFPAAVLGFNVVFHSAASSSSRVHNADMKIRFLPHEGMGQEFAPVVKALYPSSSTFGQTDVQFERNNTLGITFGYSPYGALTIGTANNKKVTTTTSANFIASGLETNCVFLTLSEDPALKQGVPHKFDFAVLLFLPDGGQDKSFMAELEVDATIGGIRGLFAGGEKKYRLEFDGVTELGRLKIGGVVQVQRSPQLSNHHPLPIEDDKSVLGVTVEEV
ncbi:hypothetical protein BT69DRAFT_1279191 [Atractiella rhizophila]|nr:hypothetical protein BT69DRAFT_1279191 [Atractiella rhizophila]